MTSDVPGSNISGQPDTEDTDVKRFQPSRNRLPSKYKKTLEQISDGLMLSQRRRRWPNIKPSLIQHIVFAVLAAESDQYRSPHSTRTI